MSYSAEHGQFVFRNLWSRITLRKPMNVIQAENDAEKLERTLGLFDLLMIGIGGTVGSGIFATAATIAAQTAGPAAVMSWILAGVGCMLSGMSFMEMSTRVPSSGSTYAYSYHAIGEWAAPIAGFLLSLEYGISGAGVARSWATKLSTWVVALGGDMPDWLDMDDNGDERQYSFLAALMMLLCVVIVGLGMQIGKTVMNGVTLLKIFVVLFIILVGLSKFHGSNLQPFIPERTVIDEESGSSAYGVAGMMLGASQAFFGYIGYDEVCCLSGETRNPIKTMPKAVMGVIVATCFLSVGATFALVGMVYYQDLLTNEIDGFAGAFRFVDLGWAAEITAAGEVLTMPVVVLISFLAQPRLMFAMAEDGMLPSIFAKIEKNGVLLYGTVISGAVMILIATVVKFDVLWDLISLGILTSFNMTNTCVIFARYRENSPKLAPALWTSFVAISLVACMMWQNYVVNEADPESWAWAISAVLTGLAVIPVVALPFVCSATPITNSDIWLVPLTPLPQVVAVAFNWYLFSQISWEHIQFFIGYLACAIGVYILYGLWFSVGNNNGWRDILDYTVAHKGSLLRNSFTSSGVLKTPSKDGPRDSSKVLGDLSTPNSAVKGAAA